MQQSRAGDPVQRIVSTKDLGLLCERACQLIETIVLEVLCEKKQDFEHLELIKAVCDSEVLKLNGIATLAHDTHVESHLRATGVKLADGFDNTLTDQCWLLWKNLFPSDGFIPFVKLHGSVDWIRIERHITRDTKDSTTARCQQPVCMESNGSGWKLANINPNLLLIGTFNKIAEYTRTIMLDIHYRFRRILEESETLVVCGYSFGDQAINSHIANWHCSEGTKLIVIDPRCPCNVIQSARPAAARRLRQPTTKFITEPMEDVDTCKFVDFLSCNDPGAVWSSERTCSL